MLYGERTLSDKEKKKLAKLDKFNAKNEKREEVKVQSEVREGGIEEMEREQERGIHRQAKERVRLTSGPLAPPPPHPLSFLLCRARPRRRSP